MSSTKTKNGNRSSMTFSPSSQLSKMLRNTEDQVVDNSTTVEDAEFQEKRWVWLPDKNHAFMKGFVVSEESDNMLKVRCTDDSDRIVSADTVEKVNPPQFNKASDMAELTYLNEASVVHNLYSRYSDDSIYTYSGLFLVAVNPYANLPIYDNDTIAAYKNKHRDETKPHIYAITDLAFRNMLELYENQSILVTGESGAGKTENTKKVIQYLAATASESHASQKSRTAKPNCPTFEEQIVQANPILEAFGNAQTVRNNNSSRFGKFIRIEFGRSGQIAGASIDWYLLEKSRVIYQNPKERNYHVFYQLLQGCSKELLEALILEQDLDQYAYLKNASKTIDGVDDKDEFKKLLSAFKIMGVNNNDQNDIFRIVSAILHIGNIELGSESADQGRILNIAQAERVCHLLGINSDMFARGLLKPRVKAGREWVQQSRSADQVKNSLDALSKSLYERLFNHIVSTINNSLEKSSDSTTFIGVLDIAGFEIFQHNSFEQLCINYTNEKLQQFFNHHMFVLEQEEYTRENIEWKFIDFGHDLQPTIDLIEKSNPMGIFSSLDEDCVMPKATDKTFTDKLTQLWDKKTNKYKSSKLTMGFTLTHYAAEVEYSTDGWLEKNKDPLNDNVTQLLVESSESLVKTLFADEAATTSSSKNGHKTTARVKKGLFRTAAQRHKEELNHLMTQLNSTHPHFVRCIIPNHDKKPRQFDNLLVLDQLRCNGVLEGIRIARSGYPNRLFFSEFRQRYEVLVSDMPKGYIEGQKASNLILKSLGLDENLYKVGLTKVFFKSGVLAELEERRESMIRQVIVQFQSSARGYLQRVKVKNELYMSQATAVIKKNFEIYLKLKTNPWWKLYVKMKPLLLASRENGHSKVRDAEYKKLEDSVKNYEEQKTKLEEEHRKTEQELERVNKTLESERTLALDKEEILKRAQARETELEDQLNKALDDLDSLETQSEELLDAKHKADNQSEVLKKELENGASLIGSLEGEKKELQSKITSLESELEELNKTQATKANESEKLNEEIKFLKSSLAQREKKVEELVQKLEASDEELEGKLKQMSSNYESANKRVEDLLTENKEIRGQLDELYSTSSDYEELVRKKESDLSFLRKETERLQSDLDTLGKEKKELKSKHEKLVEDLDKAQKEMRTLQSDYSKLEKEAEKSKKLLEEKISAGKKDDEGRRLLNQQVQDLKSKLTQEEETLSTQKLKFEGEIKAKQDLISRLQREKDEVLETNKQLKTSADEKETVLRQLEQEKKKSAEMKNISAELSSLKTKLQKTDESKKEADDYIYDLEKQAKQNKDKISSLEKSLNSVNTEKDNLSDDISKVKKNLQEITREKDNLSVEKEKLSKELDQAKRSISDEQFEKDKLSKELSQKNTQMEKLRASITEEVNNRVAKLKEEKENLEASEKKLKADLEDLNTKHETMKIQKEKMAREIEDLNHDVSREQKSALSAERMKNDIQQKLDQLSEKHEKERMDRSAAEVAKRKLNSSLESTNKELQERTDQLMALQKIINPKSNKPMDWSKASQETQKLVDLGTQLQESEKNRKKSEEARALLEAQLNDAKKRWSKDLDEKDSKYYASKRAILDDLASVSSPPGSPQKRPLSSSFSNNANNGGSLVSQRRSVFSERADGKENIEEEDTETSKTKLQGKSIDEIEEMFSSLQTSKNDLLSVYHDTSKNLVKTKELLAEAQQEKTRLERENYNYQMSDGTEGGTEAASDLKVRLEAEISRNEDIMESMKLYKGRAEEYYSRLESAESVVLKATRAESFAKSQLKETEDALTSALNDYKQAETSITELQSRVHTLEGELEDKSIDLNHSKEAQDRLNKELEYINDRHSKESVQSASSLEAMRGKYSEEIKSLSSELETEKQRRHELQNEIRRLERQLENKRGGSNNEDGSSWMKIKKQLESQVEDLSKSNEEATLANRDSQQRIGSLLSQVRTLRTTMDEITVDRDQLQKDKRTLEQRLREVSEQFEELLPNGTNSKSTSSVAETNELQELRSALKKQTEETSSISEKLRLTKEQQEQDRQAIEYERQNNEELRTSSAEAEKEKQNLNLKIIDLEARLLGPKTDESEYLREKITELEKQLQNQAQKHAEETRQTRSNDRSMKDLHNQLAQKDKHVQRLEEESERSESKVKKLKESIETIQSSESSHRMAARRAEREARDAKERSLRLEKELEDWKSRFEDLRMNRNQSSTFV